MGKSALKRIQTLEILRFPFYIWCFFLVLISAYNLIFFLSFAPPECMSTFSKASKIIGNILASSAYAALYFFIAAGILQWLANLFKPNNERFMTFISCLFFSLLIIGMTGLFVFDYYHYQFRGARFDTVFLYILFSSPAALIKNMALEYVEPQALIPLLLLLLFLSSGLCLLIIRNIRYRFKTGIKHHIAILAIILFSVSMVDFFDVEYIIDDSEYSFIQKCRNPESPLYIDNPECRNLVTNPLFYTATIIYHDQISGPRPKSPFFKGRIKDNIVAALEKIKKRISSPQAVFTEKNFITRRVIQFKSPDNIEIPGTKKIPDNKKINIIFVLMESWDWRLTGLGSSQSGVKSLTPFFDSLCQQGAALTNLYSTGVSSYEAIQGSLYSIPSSELRTDFAFQKTNPVAALVKQGYSSLMILGAPGAFNNIAMRNKARGFKKIISSDNFSKSEYSNVWGVSDRILWKTLLNELDNTSEPLIGFLHLMSTHLPYFSEKKFQIYNDESECLVKMKKNYRGASSGFFNSLNYSDWCMGQFFQSAASRPWYKNTVFVLFGDHSNLKFRKHNLRHLDFKVPGLIFCPGKIDPQIISKPCSQIDLFPSVLEKTGLPCEYNAFGRNIFNNKTSGVHAQKSYAVFLNNFYGIASEDRLVLTDFTEPCMYYKIKNNTLVKTTSDNLFKKDLQFMTSLLGLVDQLKIGSRKKSIIFKSLRK